MERWQGEGQAHRCLSRTWSEWQSSSCVRTYASWLVSAFASWLVGGTLMVMRELGKRHRLQPYVPGLQPHAPQLQPCVSKLCRCVTGLPPYVSRLPPHASFCRCLREQSLAILTMALLTIACASTVRNPASLCGEMQSWLAWIHRVAAWMEQVAA